MEISFTPLAQFQYLAIQISTLRSTVCEKIEKLANGTIDQKEISSLSFEGKDYPCIIIGEHCIIVYEIDEKDKNKARIVFINVGERDKKRKDMEREIKNALSCIDLHLLVMLATNARLYKDDSVKSAEDNSSLLARQYITEMDGFRDSIASKEQPISWGNVRDHFSFSD